jgi:hypothetical protein
MPGAYRKKDEQDTKAPREHRRTAVTPRPDGRRGFAQELAFSGQLSAFSSRNVNGSLRDDGG